MFSIVTVASSTRMPTARARPPSVMMLIVSHNALSTITDVRIDSGIDTAMINVLRQLPRNSRIISAVRQAAITASRTTSATALTKIDWSPIGLMWSCGGSVCSTRGSSARMLSTTSIVDALPAFRMVTNTPRWPSCRTMLVCGANPSLTVATSRR